MNTEHWAQLALAAYGLIALAVVWRQSGRCEHGRTVWGLYAVNRLMCGLLYHLRMNRRCPFPDDGPALIVANHRSPVDPMLLWTNHHLAGSRRRIRAINFLMAREYYEIRALNWMYRALQSIPVDREGKEAKPIRDTLRRLRAGELVGIFPEGRINTGEGLLAPGGTGVAYLALKSQVPLYPVFIHDSPQAENMVGSFLQTCHAHLTYGEPIDLSPYINRPDQRECLEEVTRLIMRRLSELGHLSESPFAEEEPAELIPLNRAAK